MSITGPAALATLDQALRDIRREEDEILRKLARGLERTAKIRDTEGELLRQMAAGRLVGDAEAELGGEIVRSGRAARQARKQGSAEISGNAGKLRRLEADLDQQVAARAAALGEIDRQQAALRALASRIGATVAHDADHAQQRQVAADARAVAAAARARLRQADLDREQKLRVFSADPLFRYLLERGYGTPAYAARGLTARLDGWVARLTGFAAARARYAVCDALPGYLRAHADRQAVVAAAAEDRLDQLERQAIDAAGGSGIRAALDAAQAQIAALDTGLAALQAAYDAAVATQTRVTEADDMGVDQALLALVRGLGSADLAALIGAERAQGRGDDPPVVQLDDARRRVAEELADSRDQRARLATLAARRRDLEALVGELKRARFDDPRSLFRDNELISERLDSFLTGAINGETYWSLWRASQAWNAGTSDWGGGVGLPRHGRESAEAGAAASSNPSRPRAAPASAGA